MAIWKYSNKHELYPVEFGDVWEVSGHRFICGDLQGTNNCIFEDAKKLKPDLMFTDPPWNDGNAKAFRTKSGVDGESGKRVDVASLISLVLGIAAERRILAYCEGGVKEQEMNKRIIERLGGKVAKVYSITYMSAKRPCLLYAADFREIPKDDYVDGINGRDEAYVEDAVVSHHMPKLIIDPCGGRGGTAHCAARHGVRSLTSELSPYRMAEAIWRVAMETGGEPKKLYSETQ